MISPSPASRPPFAPFFLLAALDAILGASVWLPVRSAAEPALHAAAWHRQELLLGMAPAVLAGFLLTALPRWTGRPRITPAALRLLVLLWLAGRAAALAAMPAAGALSAAFILVLAALAARDVALARDRRDVKVVALLSAFGLGALLESAPADRALCDFGLDLSLGALAGLVLVLGGRIVPALTAARLEARGETPPRLRVAAVERAAAASAALALGAWIVAPGAPATGYACALAAAGQLARLAQWRGWRTARHASVLALHVAYAWAAAGFGLLAVHVLQPQALGRGAAVHAWTVGALGSMSLAVMASMIRKHAGTAFARSGPMSAAYLCVAAAGVARVAPELLRIAAEPWLRLAALAWIAAFGLFLLAFRQILLRPLAARD